MGIGSAAHGTWRAEGTTAAEAEDARASATVTTVATFILCGGEGDRPTTSVCLRCW